MTIHKTVLLKEAVDALNLKPGMIVVDATLGGGGHSMEVLRKIGKNGLSGQGKLIAFDQDLDAIERFRLRISAQGGPAFGWKVGIGELSEKKSIELFQDNFSSIKDRLTSIGITSVDAIVADLGISSDQLADEDRGMSFQVDAPLDMRMDKTKGQTAAEVVNTYSQEELARVLREFGDEKYANSIARAIVSAREAGPITRTMELVDLIGYAVPGIYKRKKIHYATRSFQALRMEVNKEIETLRSFLVQAIEVLKPGGRLAIITFHSGEDVIVKNVFRENARGCICPPEFPVCRCEVRPIIDLITRKAILPSAKEIDENPRARSAKMRVAQKI